MTVLSSTTKHKKNEYAVRMPHKQFRKKAATIFIKIAAALRAESGTRTRDLFITNELLYQLSHIGKIRRDCHIGCKGNLFFSKSQILKPFFIGAEGARQRICLKCARGLWAWRWRVFVFCYVCIFIYMLSVRHGAMPPSRFISITVLTRCVYVKYTGFLS